MAKRRLATVGDLHVREPCAASWEEMPGDDRTRHCATCDRDVHDLSARSGAEADALLARSLGKKLCVRVAVVALVIAPGCSANVTTPSSDDAGAITAAPAPSASALAPTHTMGCVCVAGDPLCSCL